MRLNKHYPSAFFKALPEEGDGTFMAIVSAIGNVDYQGDVVMSGAFNKSLESWRAKGDPIPVIWSHDWSDPFANIGVVYAKDVREALPDEFKFAPDGGLLVKGKLDVEKPFAKQVYDLLKERRVTEWSFAYDTVKEKRRGDGANELHVLDLLEVGPTLKGANEMTSTIEVKSRLQEAAVEQEEWNRVHAVDFAQDVDPSGEIAMALLKSRGEKAGGSKPWHVEKQGDQYCVIKDADGTTEKCYDTREEADAYVRALYANEGKAMSDEDEAQEKAISEGAASETPNETSQTDVVWHLLRRHGNELPDGTSIYDLVDRDLAGLVALHHSLHADDTGATIIASEHAEDSGFVKAVSEGAASETPNPDSQMDLVRHLLKRHGNQLPDGTSVYDIVDMDLSALQTMHDGFHAGGTNDSADALAEESGFAKSAEFKWDGGAAMASCHNADDFRKIAFERANDSDPDTAAHWALPHHSSPGADADPQGVSSALGALSGARGGAPDLKDEAAARSHLEAHANAEKHEHAEMKAGRRLSSKTEAALSAALDALDGAAQALRGVLEAGIETTDGEAPKADEPETKADPDADLKAELDALTQVSVKQLEKDVEHVEVEKLFDGLE